MAKKCRHRNGIILASALGVEFTPDQEPFKAGVIESCGFSAIFVDAINIHYCPQCNVLQSINAEGDCKRYKDQQKQGQKALFEEQEDGNKD